LSIVFSTSSKSSTHIQNFPALAHPLSRGKNSGEGT